MTEPLLRYRIDIFPLHDDGAAVGFSSTIYKISEAQRLTLHCKLRDLRTGCHDSAALSHRPPESMTEPLLCYRIDNFSVHDAGAAVGFSSNIYKVSARYRRLGDSQTKRLSDGISWICHNNAALPQFIPSFWIDDRAQTEPLLYFHRLLQWQIIMTQRPSYAMSWAYGSVVAILCSSHYISHLHMTTKQLQYPYQLPRR